MKVRLSMILTLSVASTYATFDELWSGQGIVPSQPAVETDFGYDPSLPPLAYDPDRARAHGGGERHG